MPLHSLPLCSSPLHFTIFTFVCLSLTLIFPTPSFFSETHTHCPKPFVWRHIRRGSETITNKPTQNLSVTPYVCLYKETNQKEGSRRQANEESRFSLINLRTLSSDHSCSPLTSSVSPCSFISFSPTSVNLKGISVFSIITHFYVSHYYANMKD